METPKYQPSSTPARVLPLYPVILFIVAFLYLIGVMSWQVWKDYEYHQATGSSVIKSQVGLYANHFEDRLYVLKQLLRNSDHTTPLSDVLNSAQQALPQVLSAAKFNRDGQLQDSNGASFHFDVEDYQRLIQSFSSDSQGYGIRSLDIHSMVIVHRLSGQHGFLALVVTTEWIDAFVSMSLDDQSVYELRHLISHDVLKTYVGSSGLPADISDKVRIWSVRLSHSDLEVVGYLNKEVLNHHFTSALTPSVLVAFFYLFGGVSLIWYLTTARRQNKSLRTINRELSHQGDLILSSISDAVLVLDAEGRVQYVNNALCSLFKLNEADILELPLELEQESGMAEKLKDWTQSLLSSEQPDIDATLFIDGIVWSRVVEPSHAVLSFGSKKNVVVWVLKDITEQYRANQQLQTSQLHYQSTFEGAGVALVMVDLNELGEWLNSGTVSSKEELIHWQERNAWQLQAMLDGVVFTDVNDSACRMLDTIDEMTAIKHYKKNMFNADSGVLPALLALCRGDEERVEMSLDLSSVSGRPLYAQMNITLVKLVDHELNRVDVLFSLLDVSELRKAHEHAAKQEAFWQSLVHSVPDILYVNDISTHSNIFVNHDIGEILGYSKEETAEMGDRYWQRLLHPDSYKVFKDEMARFKYMERGSVKETVLQLKHKDGSWREFVFRDTPFTRDENGRVARYIGMGRDVTEFSRAQRQVSNNERYLQVLAENIRDLVWVMDHNFHFKFVSPSIKQLLGYEPEEVLDRGVRTFLAEDQFDLIKGEIAEPLMAVMKGDIDAKTYRNKTGEHVVEVMALHRDGHYLVMEVKVGLLWDEADNFEGLLGSCRDVTQRQKRQAEIKLAAEVFESSNEAILIADMDGDIVRANRAFFELTRYDRDEVYNHNLSMMCTEQQTAGFYKDLLEVVQTSGYWQGEVWHRKKTGEPYPAWVGVSSVKNDDGMIDSYIVIFSDRTEHKEAEEKIHRLAYYDPLTELANRSLFMERLRLEMRHADDYEGALVLLYLDLDNFKPVNDTMGHEAGDILLIEVARRLESCVRASDTVARMGGDEFTVILPDQRDLESARSLSEHVASQIISALREPIAISDMEFKVTVSVGIAIYPEHGQDASELLRHADKAMYQAKESGRDLYRMFTG